MPVGGRSFPEALIRFFSGDRCADLLGLQAQPLAGVALKVFGPTFEQRGAAAEIWFGTMSAPEDP